MVVTILSKTRGKSTLGRQVHQAAFNRAVYGLAEKRFRPSGFRPQGCEDLKRLQSICDGLSAEKIDTSLRKWLRLLPHLYSAADRKPATAIRSRSCMTSSR